MELTKVSKSEFKAKALEYFRQVESTGETLIVTNHGKPTLEVRPYKTWKRNPLEILHGSIVRFDAPLEPVAASDWEAT